MTTEQAKDTKILGRVQKVFPRERLGYGFIVTDDWKKFFFHAQDVAGQLLPDPGSKVKFHVVRASVDAKNPEKKLHDHAVNIEIVSVPG